MFPIAACSYFLGSTFLSKDGMVTAYQVNENRTARKRFTIGTFIVAIGLLAWGAFVTSINAGMAVPDWPTSFNSYDPFNPWPEWWNITPVFAEHGHRLLGALVGFLTLTLAVWTWFKESRVWMKRLGLGALLLVILQGVLGGLRVLFVSIDLAVVHAMVAQLFFALLASMIVFTSRAWLNEPSSSRDFMPFADLKRISFLAPLFVYVQIFLGALLRHPGTGIEPFLVGLHLGWAFVATSILVVFWSKLRAVPDYARAVKKLSSVMIAVLSVQVALGLFAYLVLLDESGLVKASNVQVIANTSHMVIGALLFASTVATSVLCRRYQHLESALEPDL